MSFTLNIAALSRHYAYAIAFANSFRQLLHSDDD